MSTNPSVTLAWDAASGAASYRVHYGTQSGAYTHTTPDVTGTSTTAEGLSTGLTYYFAATSRNGSGVESGYSNQVSYAVPDVAKTTPSVTLGWDASSGATAYRVRYGTQNGVYPSVAPRVTGTSTTVGNLSPGATYYFVATALNASGQEGGPSNEVSYAVPPAAIACSLFARGSVPVYVTDYDPSPVELGVAFRPSRPGQITAIRFYKGRRNSGPHTAHLWDDSGKPLASAPFAKETTSGWQQVNLSVPVQVAANTLYVASYHAARGHYSADRHYFVSARTIGPLTAPVNAGVYRYGSTPAFPNQTYQASNYWVDVVFVG